jgi:hypothetical protein
MSTIDWLLAGDPSIRYWTRTLLLGESAAADRARIAKSGWGARLLAARDSSGRWGGGLYMPQWISTHYTLLELMGLGIDPKHRACRESARLMLDEGFLPDGGIALWTARRTDHCVAAMLLSMLAYFQVEDPRVEAVARALLAAQMADGGWNCRRDAACASIHTTLSVLEAFDELARNGRGDRRLRAASSRGRESLFARRLYRSRKTGEPVDRKVTSFTYPPRWRFDVLRCLFAFARAAVPFDERMRDGLDLVIARRGTDGRWRAGAQHPGRAHFVMEPARGPGRWNTLRASFVPQRWTQDERGLLEQPAAPQRK